ncbi:hypothetical protein CRUP_020432 [Coryphaenoides rupestris]|nr:hypothetical protein CRUP_020432 [Coryphaenoides rupestris]
MASRRAANVPTVKSSDINTSTDSAKSSQGEHVKANNSGTGKKSHKPSVTIVKSRYMQSIDKSLSKKSATITPRPSSPKPSFAKPKAAASPRRSVAPMPTPTLSVSTLLEPSLLGKSVLHSTFSDGHFISPNFDVSFIKDKTVMLNSVEHERTPEMKKTVIERQTFLLAYITAKMQHNTAKLKAQAEAQLLEVMEEEDRLYDEVQEKKRKYLLRERNKQMNEILDLQIAALTPLAEESKRFTEDYRTFAAAVDTTRHELPVKNCYMEADGQDFLDKAESCLKQSARVLAECTHTDQQDSSSAVDCLRGIKTASKDITQQMSGMFSELLELSSEVSRYTVQTQQALEEDHLGSTRTRELYCSEP